MVRIIFIALTVLYSFECQAQYLDTYKGYDLLTPTYNQPELAGLNGNWNAAAGIGSYDLFDWTFPRISGTIDGYVDKLKTGISTNLMVITDGGFYNKQIFNLSINKRFKISEDLTLLGNFGAGYLNYRINFTNPGTITYTDYMNFGFGVGAVWKKYFFASHLSNIGRDSEIFYNYNNVITSTLIRTFDVNEDFKLCAKIQMNNYLDSPLAFKTLASISANVKNVIGAVSYGNYRLRIASGYNIQERLRLAYAFEFSTSKLGSGSPLHSIAINYNITKPKNQLLSFLPIL